MWSGQSMSAEPDAILHAKFLKLQKIFLIVGLSTKLLKKKCNMCWFNKAIFSLNYSIQKHNVTGWTFFLKNIYAIQKMLIYFII